MSQHASHSSPHIQRAAGSSQGTAAATHISKKSACDADIARRAYGKYEARGRTHGFDREDWIAASHELITETFGHSSLIPSRSLSALPDGKQFPGS
jgi:hypothetical protein